MKLKFLAIIICIAGYSQYTEAQYQQRGYQRNAARPWYTSAGGVALGLGTGVAAWFLYKYKSNKNAQIAFSSANDVYAKTRKLVDENTARYEKLCTQGSPQWLIEALKANKPVNAMYKNLIRDIQELRETVMQLTTVQRTCPKDARYDALRTDAPALITDAQMLTNQLETLRKNVEYCLDYANLAEFLANLPQEYAQAHDLFFNQKGGITPESYMSTLNAIVVRVGIVKKARYRYFTFAEDLANAATKLNALYQKYQASKLYNEYSEYRSIEPLVGKMLTFFQELGLDVIALQGYHSDDILRKQDEVESKKTAIAQQKATAEMIQAQAAQKQVDEKIRTNDLLASKLRRDIVLQNLCTEGKTLTSNGLDAYKQDQRLVILQRALLAHFDKINTAALS